MVETTNRLSPVLTGRNWQY